MNSVVEKLDVAGLRAEFPILSESVRGKPLVYLDNGATSQKPLKVIETLDRYYRTENANIHRGVHFLSQESTALYEAARTKIKILLNVRSDREIIFTKGCTEGINLVASSWGSENLKAGDVVVSTVLEHHSNIVPWQMIAQRKGARVVAVPIDNRGVLDLDAYARFLADGNVKLVAIQHISNAIGTVHPIAKMIEMAHAAGALALVDGAQAAPHTLIDVQALDADFYVISPHKMYGPTGIGALYGKEKLLEAMPPYQGGGDMIHTVSFEGTTYAPLPAKFEAGTPPIAAAIGLGAAVEFLGSLGSGATLREKLRTSFEKIHAHEMELLAAGRKSLANIEGVKLIGNAAESAAIISFALDHVHPHDVGTFLDMDGVAVRTGHHCCQPLMTFLGLPATTRASFALYNTEEEVEVLAKSVSKVSEVFR